MGETTLIVIAVVIVYAVLTSRSSVNFPSNITITHKLSRESLWDLKEILLQDESKDKPKGKDIQEEKLDRLSKDLRKELKI